MIKVLSIGNSFSQDATRYLNEIADFAAADLMAQNLYIGGCSLEMHYNNVIEGKEVYEMQVNANPIYMCSIKSALQKEDWDFITIQQVSNLSVDYGTYQPYLTETVKYIKKYCKNAKILLHQTWSYENGSQRLCEEMGYKNSCEMFYDIQKAYNKAAEDINADGIIPSGKLFNEIAKETESKIHRDTFHASLGLGRYALGLLWYKFFTKRDIDQINFDKFDEEISIKDIKIIKKCINDIL